MGFSLGSSIIQFGLWISVTRLGFSVLLMGPLHPLNCIELYPSSTPSNSEKRLHKLYKCIDVLPKLLYQSVHARVG